MIHAHLFPPPHHTHRSSPLKRKRDVAEQEDGPLADKLLPYDERPPPSKRAHSLEAGFSLMSLTSSPTNLLHDRPPWSPEHVELQVDPAGMSMSSEDDREVLSCPVVEMADDSSEDNRIGVNDRDSSDSYPDVVMKRSTWYEKDKDHIVILDLDSDDDETPASSPPPEFTISRALLSRLPVPTVTVPPPPPDTGQLVLYQPSPWRELKESTTRSRNVDAQDVYPSLKDPVPSTEEMDIEEL